MGVLYANVNGNWEEVTGGFVGPTGPTGPAGGGLTQAQADTRYVNITGDTMTGKLTATGGLEINQGTINTTPTAAAHFANKAYVDTHLTQAEADARYVNNTSDTMSGDLTVGADPNNAAGCKLHDVGNIHAARTTGQPVVSLNFRGTNASTGGLQYIKFTNTDANDVQGSITKNGPGKVAYNETSDYRLKSDHGPILDALDRVRKLIPRRIVWKEDPEQIEQDGWFAHEVAEAVPEAVMGDKDAVATDEDVVAGSAKTVGQVMPQQFAPSGLLPLLTAALQAALDRIDTLEARVAVLEAP